jgi:hypothetical protein
MDDFDHSDKLIKRFTNLDLIDKKYIEYIGPSIIKLYKLIYDKYKDEMMFGCWRIFRIQDLNCNLEEIHNQDEIKHFFVIGGAKHYRGNKNVYTELCYIPSTDNFFFQKEFICDNDYWPEEYHDMTQYKYKDKYNITYTARKGKECEKLNLDKIKPESYTIYKHTISQYGYKRELDTFDDPFDYKELMQYEFDDMIQMLFRTRHLKNFIVPTSEIDMLTINHDALKIIYYGIMEQARIIRFGKWIFQSPNDIKMIEYEFKHKFIHIATNFAHLSRVRHLYYIPKTNNFFFHDIKTSDFDDDIKDFNDSFDPAYLAICPDNYHLNKPHSKPAIINMEDYQFKYPEMMYAVMNKIY